jgi:DNA excision repair protein ERCC-2
MVHYWSEFQQAMEFEGEEFFTTFTPGRHGGAAKTGGILKITCCDASKWLTERYKEFSHVVAFSATLKPFDYYLKLLGLKSQDTEAAEFTSPFPKANRKLMIIPQVSTKLNDRQRNFPKIKDGIERIVRVKPGNYFVFFPSFAFLEQVGALLNLPEFDVLLQKRDMRRAQIEDYIERLREGEKPTLILAVQGGVFAEGVDYPGDMLIGAIVVGPGLPTFDFERELLRHYYEKVHGSHAAFDYAYTFPAMAKVVQAAGRVIRSAEDRGLIVLMDRRFLHASYVNSMPEDWTNEGTAPLVSESVLADISHFWERP